MTAYYGSYTTTGTSVKFRAYMNVTTSSTNTTYTITANGGMTVTKNQSPSFGATGKLTVGSNTKSGTGSWSGSKLTSDTNKSLVANTSYTYTRTHATQSISVNFQTYKTSDGTSKSSTASTTVSIPARPSYTVTYNANGGSGSATATKWYDESLTVHNGSGFSKPNCLFLGWNTKTDGTGTTYAVGSTYTGNAAITLYAIWKPLSGIWYKENGEWIQFSKLYKKENGAWVEITKEDIDVTKLHKKNYIVSVSKLKNYLQTIESIIDLSNEIQLEIWFGGFSDFSVNEKLPDTTYFLARETKWFNTEEEYRIFLDSIGISRNVLLDGSQTYIQCYF